MSQTTNNITALGNAFKSQAGDPLSGEHIAQLLIHNMSQVEELAKQGKLTQQQVQQLKQYANKHKVAATNSTFAMATNQPNLGQPPTAQTTNDITALGNAFKSQTRDPLSGEHIAQLLTQNMSQLEELAKQGKLTQQQVQQLKRYADKHKVAATAGVASAQPAASTSTAAATPTPTNS